MAYKDDPKWSLKEKADDNTYLPLPELPIAVIDVKITWRSDRFFFKTQFYPNPSPI